MEQYRFSVVYLLSGVVLIALCLSVGKALLPGASSWGVAMGDLGLLTAT